LPLLSWGKINDKNVFELTRVVVTAIFFVYLRGKEDKSGHLCWTTQRLGTEFYQQVWPPAALVEGILKET
jgi:hypothetical protein